MLNPLSHIRLFLACIILFTAVPTPASDFSFSKKGGAEAGATLLIIGGIDGDEPGGFHAAATLTTRYQINNGQLWIVPNLNQRAILERVRGEMNLKFAHIEKNDPLYPQVKKIKKIILDEQVDLVINLHDGSGFYHPTRLNSQRNPWRWGQSIVIDQENLSNTPYGGLYDISAALISRINPAALSPDGHFQIKNMRTPSLDETSPTPKSLSYFAVRHGKPALSFEASKSFPVHIRTYYHLVALEALMDEVGISYSRDFELTPAAVARVVREDAQMTLAQGRIHLDLNSMSSDLEDFPLTIDPLLSFLATNPLISLQPENDKYRIHYGNNRLALLHPRWVEIDPQPEPLAMIVDGIPLRIQPGTIVEVNSQVRIDPQPNYEIKIAGINGKDSALNRIQIINGETSIDQSGRLLRLEIYRDQLFSGMILLDFRAEN